MKESSGREEKSQRRDDIKLSTFSYLKGQSLIKNALKLFQTLLFFNHLLFSHHKEHFRKHRLWGEKFLHFLFQNITFTLIPLLNANAF